MMLIRTKRLHLRAFRRDDHDWFAALHADPLVMHDYGGPLTREESEAKLTRYRISAQGLAIGRLAVDTLDGRPVGYTGIMSSAPDHPLGPHWQIGWRLMSHVWGAGLTPEAAAAALETQFRQTPDIEVLAYTGVDNLRSQRVMAKLGLRRDPSRDHSGRYAGGDAGPCLTWVADAAMAPRST